MRKLKKLCSEYNVTPRFQSTLGKACVMCHFEWKSYEGSLCSLIVYEPPTLHISYGYLCCYCSKNPLFNNICTKCRRPAVVLLNEGDNVPTLLAKTLQKYCTIHLIGSEIVLINNTYFDVENDSCCCS
jgi:hypothetical protein